MVNLIFFAYGGRRFDNTRDVLIEAVILFNESPVRMLIQFFRGGVGIATDSICLSVYVKTTVNVNGLSMTAVGCRSRSNFFFKLLLK